MNLSTEDTGLFYRLRFSLLAYVNRHLQIIPPLAASDGLSKRPSEQIGKLREALHSTPDLLERYVAENPEDLPADDLAVVASWRHRISGDFYIMRYLKPYAVFMSARPPHLYGVLALVDPLDVLTRGAPLPVYIQASLLPFRGRIVYDGILYSYNVFLGRGISSGLNEEYGRLKEEEGIIEQLVGPDGEAQVRTSLDRRAPRKPAPDWRPALEEIAASVEKMRPTDTKLQGAAVALLRAAAGLAQAAFQEKGAEAAAAAHLRAVRRALTKLDRLLYRWEYD